MFVIGVFFVGCVLGCCIGTFISALLTISKENEVKGEEYDK